MVPTAIRCAHHNLDFLDSRGARKLPTNNETCLLGATMIKPLDYDHRPTLPRAFGHSASVTRTNRVELAADRVR
jgi:hypothetical protein